jgi:hypothetical protein
MCENEPHPFKAWLDKCQEEIAGWRDRPTNSGNTCTNNPTSHNEDQVPGNPKAEGGLSHQS